MNLGGKEARDRFIFVLNKCDALDEEKGETVGQKINEAKDYLKEFEIVDPMIIPTNAQLALIIQKVRNGDKLTRKENSKYRDIEYYIEEKELHYEDYAIVHQDVKDEIKKQLTKYKKENDKGINSIDSYRDTDNQRTYKEIYIMTKFTIEYNPYIQKITFRKNDTILNSKNRIGAKQRTDYKNYLEINLQTGKVI